MKYDKYFTIIIIISSLSGIFIGILSNNMIDPNKIENQTKNTKKDNTEQKEKKEETLIKEKKEVTFTKEEKKEDKKEEKKEINKEENEEVKDENKDNKIIEIQTQVNFRENKTIIAVSYATDNRYIYPTIVSITSLAYNAANNSFYDIYILHTPDFNEYSKNFLKSVEKKYPERCAIIYINMENKYRGLGLNYRITTPTYYRLSLQDLLPNVKRIIYLDGDTLILEDLQELINLNMKGSVVMGFLDIIPDAISNFGFKQPTVVCGGTLLMDLEGLRKYGYSKKIEEFISKNRDKLKQQDQTVLNVVIQDRLKPIPPKYGIWAWVTDAEAKEHLDKQWPHLKYNEEEFFYALNHPAIIHYTWPKPFWKGKKTRYQKEWWDYAKLTGYYNEIYAKIPSYRNL